MSSEVIFLVAVAMMLISHLQLLSFKNVVITDFPGAILACVVIIYLMSFIAIIVLGLW